MRELARNPDTEPFPRTILVSTFLNYQAAAVHPHGSFAAFAGASSTRNLHLAADNMVRKSPGLCTPNTEVHILHDLRATVPAVRDGVFYHYVQPQQSWPADGNRWVLLAQFLRNRTHSWDCAYAIDITDVVVLRLPPCRALHSVTMASDTGGSKSWLRKQARRTGLGQRGSPELQRWLETDTDQLVVNCGVVGGPRAHFQPLLERVERLLVDHLSTALPEQRNVSGVDMVCNCVALASTE